MIKRLALAALIALSACNATTDQASRTRVASGDVQGAVVDGIAIFKSIPYAAAPTGERRFRAPQPPEPWTGARDATKFGPSCTQNISAEGWGPWTGEFTPQGAVSEDCLTLSVWAPAEAENAPVFVWIPGGAFTDGGEATAIYDGAALAKRGLVVVSINYRLNAFGLLANGAIDAEADGARGNQALRDSIAALEWVQENASAFGGDPSSVTIAGQSAGGALVYALLDAPAAEGLFARAIIQSFPPGTATFPNQADALATGTRFGEKLGATTAEQLRAASAESVLAASQDAGLDLNVDNVLIDAPYGASFPLANDVPILIGLTKDETSFMSHDLAAYRETAARYGQGFTTLYPATDDASAFNAVLDSQRDAVRAVLQRFADAHARASGQPLYLYLWTHTLPGPDAAKYRAFHSAELIYMFGSFAAAPQRTFTDQDRAISETMISYWSNFAKTGDPNGEGLARWGAADVGAPNWFELGEKFAPAEPLSPEATRFFNAYYDRTGGYVFE